MILIAPVNQGAHVARIQPLYQTVSSLFAINSKRTSQALAQLSDGIGQAAEDLLPGSAFLRRLNGGTRPPDVPYHILAGDVGILSRDIRQQAQAQLEVASRDSGVLEHVFPRGQPRALLPARRADRRLRRRLRGRRADPAARRPDHVTIRANHAELIRAPMFYPDEGPVPCLPYVLRWLEADMKRPVTDDRGGQRSGCSPPRPSRVLGFAPAFE